MATNKKAAEERPKVQPKCTGCNHSKSFHASGECMVMGCTCKKWNGPKVLTRKEREALGQK